MTARERVIAFLLAQPRSFCDRCLARALGIDPSTAYKAAMRISRSAEFARAYGACSECGDSRLLTCAPR